MAEIDKAIARMRAHTLAKQAAAHSDARHRDLLEGNFAIQETILKSFQGLVQYLQSNPNTLLSAGGVATTNSELMKKLDDVVEAIKAQELHVDAPQVHPAKVEVAAPIVKVPALDTKPIAKEVAGIKKAIDDQKHPDIEDGALKTQPTNALINVKFDRFAINYDNFDEASEPVIDSIAYFLKNKKVATLKYTYDSDGNLTGGKRL